MVTVIRYHGQGNKFAQVVTVLTASGMEVYYQVYESMENGGTSLIKDSAWSGEQVAIEYFNGEVAKSIVRGAL